MGVLISLLYPSYLATKVSIEVFVIFNTSSSPVPFTNDFLGYHLADLYDLGRQGKCCSKNYGIKRPPITSKQSVTRLEKVAFITETVQIRGQSKRMLVNGGLLLTF